ncbi:MAG: ribosome recycling factor [Candidatus Glassbacteria bacterium]
MRHELLIECEKSMSKTLERLEREFASIRTGIATPSLLDTIKIEAYGSTMNLKEVANVGAPEPRLLVVQPWDKTLIPAIEKAIMTSDLDLNPANDGTFIRIPIPQLTEERRKQLVKVVHKLAEEGRIAVRSVRRDTNTKIKKREKDGEMSEDDSHKLLDHVQELTDKYTKLIDEILNKKEKEIMEV